MKKVQMIVMAAVLSIGLFRPGFATDGFLGGGLYTTDAGIIPAVRFGIDDTYLFDVGFNFTTVDANNYAVLFKGIARFTDVKDVHIHGGAMIGIAELENDTGFQLGFLIGAEAPISDSFSVTADIAPLSIMADGDTEALFLQGEVGLNLYLRGSAR
jgi:hypothetical protein